MGDGWQVAEKAPRPVLFSGADSAVCEWIYFQVSAGKQLMTPFHSHSGSSFKNDFAQQFIPWDYNNHATR